MESIAAPAEARHGDIADQASWSVQSDVTVALAKIAREEGQQAADFRARQLEGIHNECKDCGYPISQARRKAIPHAIRCTKCHEAKES